MGSFLTSVHARVPEGVMDAGARVVAALTELVAPLRPCATGEASDRELVVLVEDGWVSVYDQASESQGGALEAVGGALSQALGGVGFSVLVHDSDVLMLDLFRDGAVVDRYDSNPAYFTGHGQRRRAVEVASAWSAALGVDAAQLTPAFEHRGIFAENALPLLGQALGLSALRLSVGHRYLADVAPLKARATVLQFRADERPPWERTRSGPTRLITDEEHALEETGAEQAWPAPESTLVAVGGEVHLTVNTHSAGGPGVGLRVVVEGGPDVAWERVEVVCGVPGQGPWYEAALVEQGDRWVATLPDAPVPAGRPPIDPVAMQQALAAGADMRAMLGARSASQVCANAHGTAGAPSAGTVRLTVEPLEGRGAREERPVQVVSTSHRPLRAPAEVDPSLLEPLSERTHLVAFVSVEDVAAGAEIARALAPHVPKARRVRVTRWRDGMPRLSSRKARGFLTRKRFAKLVAKMPDKHTAVTIQAVDSERSLHGKLALYLGTSIGPIHDADLLATLVLSLEVAAIDVDAATAALREAIDASATAGKVLQGVLTRWGGEWVSVRPGRCPYEEAVGIHFTNLGRRVVVERWLRAVGEGSVWLGPAVRSFVPEVQGVELSGSLRLDVSDVAGAEQALADVLPTVEQVNLCLRQGTVS